MRTNVLLLFSLIVAFGLQCQAQTFHDAAALDLIGNVKTVKEDDTTYSFLQNGKMEDESVSEKDLVRDNDNYLVKSPSAFASALYKYKYFGGKKLLDQKIVSSDLFGNSSQTFTRNSEGIIVRNDVIYILPDDAESKDIKEYYVTYSNHRFDSHGNWVYRLASKSDGKTKEEIREITYWDNTGGSSTTTSESATIKSISAEYDVYSNGVKGMNVLLSFTIYGQKDKRPKAIAYFEYRDGTPIKDLNHNYWATDGQVCSSTYFTPSWDGTDYNQLKIFIPYDELHQSSGKHKLRTHVTIWNDTATQALARSENLYFTLTQP